MTGVFKRIFCLCRMCPCACSIKPSFLSRSRSFFSLSRFVLQTESKQKDKRYICVRYDRKFGKIFFQNRRFVRINYRKRTHSCSFSDTKQWGKNEQNEYHERIKGVLT